MCLILSGVMSVEELVRSCQTSHLEQELVNKYILIEDYFMRESLCKAKPAVSQTCTVLFSNLQAVSMDTCNPGSFISSMADDIFFVLQKCTRSVVVMVTRSVVEGLCM